MFEKIRKEYDLLDSPPIDCEFSIASRVIFTNEYGIEFEVIIVGFSNDSISFGKYGRFIHTVRDTEDAENRSGREDAVWFPNALKSFRKNERK